MGKRLSEMTLEELWQLFPIFLTEHSDIWRAWYLEKERAIREILPAGDIADIQHIGSTAIEGIWAKPIVDILVEIVPGRDMEAAAARLSDGGWICMSRSAGRMSFNMGYTEEGFAPQVFHLHLRYAGDNDEVYFRDYMNAHPGAAKEYENLKLGLWKKYEHDRDGYTNAKTEFVSRYTTIAKMRYEHMDNSDFEANAEQLFDILFDNMSAISPGGKVRDDEYSAWRAAVGGGMKQPRRRIVLMKCGAELAGFFQYYTNDDTFMMEEIQIKPEYRGKYGMFRELFNYLREYLHGALKHVKAYAEVSNAKSMAILGRMGLSRIADEDGFAAFAGDIADFYAWLDGDSACNDGHK